MSEEGRWDLPSSWQWARATEFATVVGGGTPKNAKSVDNYAADGIPWITPVDLSGYKGAHISRGGRDLSEKGFISCSARLMPKGTVLLSSRAPVGYCVVASNEISTNQGFKSFVPHSGGIAPEFLRYYLIGSKQYLESEASGTTFLELSGARAEHLLFPIAPTDEQKRIVSKIDELFSRIEEGERALEQVSKLVERYRQSVLKAAVTGELTRDWRAARRVHDEPVESGEALLTRILTARRQAWEQAELTKMKAKGIKPANDNWKKKYAEPVPPDIAELPKLPGGWVWSSMDQLTTKITSGSRDWKDYYGRGDSVFVMAQNVRPGRLDLSERQMVDPPSDDRDAARSEIRQHDLLLTIVGANTGDVCRVREPLERHYVCQSVALARPVLHSLSVFMELFLCADEGGQAEFAKVIYGAGRPHLSFDQLRVTPVPLPPFDEQGVIADAVAKAEPEISAVAAAASWTVNTSNAMRQSVLKAAFSGELVLQNPTEEPATTLLERIAVERATPNTSAPKGRRKKKSA